MRGEGDAASDWNARQDQLAARAVAYGSRHSPEIAGRLKGAGMSAGDIAGVADLRAIPVLAKDDLPTLQAADPPFGGMLAVAAGSLARIFRSPGPISDPQGAGGERLVASHRPAPTAARGPAPCHDAGRGGVDLRSTGVSTITTRAAPHLA